WKSEERANLAGIVPDIRMLPYAFFKIPLTLLLMEEPRKFLVRKKAHRPTVCPGWMTMLHIILNLKEYRLHLLQILHVGFGGEDKQHFMALRNVNKADAAFHAE